jgi:voltage-gated potassium channel
VDGRVDDRGVKSPHLERTVALPAIILALVCLLGGAGAAAAFESDTVGSFWGGLWWALCLMTTVGYVYGPPVSTTATVVSAVLVLVGFLLLSLLSATLAALFIRRDAEPAELLPARARDPHPAGRDLAPGGVVGAAPTLIR